MKTEMITMSAVDFVENMVFYKNRYITREFLKHGCSVGDGWVNEVVV